MANDISIDADFVINEQPDIQADLHINYIPDISNLVTREELAEDLADKQDALTAGANITIDNNVISATDTTYTAGEGISIEDNVISNTQTSAEWGNIEGDIQEQTDLIDLIDTKIEIEATARENNDLLLQNGINTLNNDLTAEISNRGTADGILQGNIDTLSGTVSNNYTTLDGKISNNKTTIDNHIADKTNPHEVTKSQVGLGNVDNTSDLNKPISTATQQALDNKVPTSRTVNGKALTNDITLTASDVDALPDTTKYAASLSLSIDSSTYVVTAQLKDQDGNNLGTAQTIDLPLESVVVSGSYDSANKKVVLTLENGSTIEFSIADLVSGLQTEITSNNKLDADLVDDSTSTHKFATASQLAQIGTNQTDIGTINSTIGGYGDIVTHDANEFATSTQGGKADTAVQSVNNTQPDSNGNVTLSIPSTANMVTTNTAQDISARKTFVGEKAIYFKQSSDSDKLGFTLYNRGGDEKGYLEYNPSNKVDNVPLMTLGNYAMTSDNITHVGFRRYSSVGGEFGAYNLLTPLITDAKTPFNLTKIYTNFYMPLGFTDGRTTVKTAKSGVVDLSTLMPDVSGKQETSNLVTTWGQTPSNSKYPSEKLVFDTIGDIETLLNTINSGSST